MNIYKKSVIFCLALFMMPAGVDAQNISGYVKSTSNQPIADVVITSPGCQIVLTDKDGHFLINGYIPGNAIKIWHDGYYTQNQYVYKQGNACLSVHLIEEHKTRYNETVVSPAGLQDNKFSSSAITNINTKDFNLGSLSIDNVFKGDVPGLLVTNKSGMTGEGSYLSLRGIRSLLAETSPLVVINGIPYMPDENVSQIIGGYSRSVFEAFNNLDISNITVLKGSEAAVYGSLGANGVILIETKQPSETDMNTHISFSAVYGTNWNSKRIPLMDSQNYRSYLEDIGLTYYSNMENFFNDFTFLSDPKANHSYLYKYDTDWQNQIYRTSNTSDYLFRVEGGDNIAKYNISLGYLNDQGTLKNTKTQRYNAQINANVLVSKKFQINANVNAAFMRGQYQEQGLSYETNPLLAACRRSPLLSPYSSDMYGSLIDEYSTYDYGAITNEDFEVSNPLAIVNLLQGKNRQYDINAKVGFLYHPTHALQFTGAFGLYYNYNQEQIFIPGKTSNDIVPIFDQYGKAYNSARVGTDHTFNIFYTLGGNYKWEINKDHTFNFGLNTQTIWDSYEYDAAFGRNSDNDYYQTLGDAQTLGKYFSGYNDKWNWLFFQAYADYTYRDLLHLSINGSYDGASSIGEDATRMSFYPLAKAVLSAKHFAALERIDWLNQFDINAGYGVSGNSRFSSKFGKYYYTSRPYQTIAGIIRATVPNTKLKAERDYNLDLGLQTSMLNNRVQLKFNYYNTQAHDVLLNGSHSVILGTSPYYSNDGKISSKGVEISLNIEPVLTHNFKWYIGGTLTTLNNKIKSLGDFSQIISTLSDDAEIISKVGENPYAFYGYKTQGVFVTTADAEAASLVNQSGVAYKAGDVHYVDMNNDHIINDEDRVILGSATPKFYGDVFTRFEYKNFALDMTFTYTSGNKAYNAVRRITESGLDLSNQATSMERRWSMEGQVTDIPRVSYGDEVGNNDFSDRWIENASYIKLHDVTLSYAWKKPLLKFIQGGTLYVTGQNLFCITDYLGLDPEFSYSYSSVMQGVDYGKVCAPRSVKLGINLKF